MIWKFTNKQVTCQKTSVGWDDFKDFLEQVRQRANLSQERLGNLLGYDRTYIWRLENGYNRPSRAFLHNLNGNIVLMPEEIRLLNGFIFLREYHCEHVDLE